MAETIGMLILTAALPQAGAALAATPVFAGMTVGAVVGTGAITLPPIGKMAAARAAADADRNCS